MNQWLAIHAQEGFICGEGSNDHLVDCVENFALPIIVVHLHLFVPLGRLLEGALLNSFEVDVANVVIILHETCDLVDAVLFKVFAELGNVHNFGRFEIDWRNYYSILNRVNLLFDVSSVLQDASLHLFETFDG